MSLKKEEFAMMIKKARGTGRQLAKGWIEQLLDSDRIYDVFAYVCLVTATLFALVVMTSAASAAMSTRVTGRGPTAVLARRDAFRQAVEQRVGVLITAKTIVVENRVVVDKVLTSSEGLISGYVLVDSGVEADGVHFVTMDVEVDDTALTAAVVSGRVDRGLVRANLGDPRIGVRVQGPAWASSELVTMLHDAGFSRVNTSNRGQDGFFVDCWFTDATVSRPRSMGFERDFTCTVACHVRVVDNIGDVAMQTSTSGSAWSTTSADATTRAQQAALQKTARVLTDWLATRARTPERHLRAEMHGFTPADAQRLLENTSGVTRVFIRRAVGTDVLAELDADCTAVELSMGMATEHPDVVVNAGDGTLYIWSADADRQRKAAKREEKRQERAAAAAAAEQPVEQQAQPRTRATLL